MTVVFVCTGNTCRSPMAEGIAKTVAPDIKFSSAGLSVNPYEPVAENAVAVMREIGVDISAHKPTQLTANAVEDADYIVPMTASHKAALLSAGVDSDKIVEFSEPVSDPYGGDEACYRVCRDQLFKLIKSLSEQMKWK